MSNGLIISFLLLFVFILSGSILSILTSIIFSPLVHTPRQVLKDIIDLMKVKDNDVIYDLGSGDGRVIIAARKMFKVKGYGYDISPIMVSLSKLVRIANLGLNMDTIFDVENIFDVKLDKATVIYVYQNPKILALLHKKFKREIKGVKVFSYQYEIPEVKYKHAHKLSNDKKLYEYSY